MPRLFWRKNPSQDPVDIPSPSARADALSQQAIGWLKQLERAAASDLAQTLVDAAAHLSGSEKVLFIAENARTLEWMPRAARGFSPQAISDMRLTPTSNLSAHFSAAPQVFPLRVNGRPWGTLATDALSQEEAVSLLSLLVDHAATRFAHEELRAHQEALIEQTVEAFSRAIEAKDSNTHGHLSRVRTLARILAQAMNLPEGWIRHIERGAHLHDIGKLGIPDAILLKPDRLTEEEYAIIKRHPMIGYELMSAVPALEPAACIALSHQEWFNGQGYPEGLAGQEIPLGARLVSVVDAWDAMVSDRPYRKAMPKSAAIAELRRCAGTQFDPKIVDVFLKTGPAV